MRQPAVTATDLVVGLPGGIALDRSTFQVPTGAVTAVIGPNGSGKSSLLNAIAGLAEPTSGSIEVAARAGGQDRVAYVMQSTKVNEALPVTVAEVVMMGRYAALGPFRRVGSSDRAAVSDAMARTGITSIRGRHLHDLSAGQRQRVFVAQGLAQKHDLLLLDEPMTGLDLPTAKAIDEIIHDEVLNGTTVVLTTHDLSEAQAAEHVLLLAGRVIASGPPKEVLVADNLAVAYGPAQLHFERDQLMIDDAAHSPAEGRHVHRSRGRKPR